ncbi:uncharacterized protein LOC108905722 [Anoplophora glabripennis]|uniref:uncharacterized protein LOC108905722 n=1 Tax=Anoplophora glabripennis TaxID=217634 RepID=UPI000874CE31|nr:uncharacterized protein LOC108905722 [Anoplophora glabripennis]
MSINKFPFEIRPIQPELDEKIKSLFLGEKDGSVEIGPKKYIFSSKYGQTAETIYNFEVRSDDVWIVTFPRSGTTLMQEMAWLILNEDYDTAKKVSLFKRFPFLELSTLISDHLMAEITEDIVNDKKIWEEYKESLKPRWEILENTVGRRFIKSHLPLSLLPPTLLTSGAKVVYIARNPKNAAISRYHQDRSLGIANYVGNFDQYWDLFEKNLVYFTPYWEHLEEAWQQRSNKNLLFFFYEDVVKDYKKAIVELSNFLEKTMNEEQISKLADYLRIDNFRNTNLQQTNTMVKLISLRGPYQHVRTGKSGDWNDYFTQELDARANKWTEENYKNTTLRFPVKLYCFEMGSIKFPYLIEPQDPAVDKKLKALFLGQRNISVTIGPKRFVHRLEYGLVAERIYNFEVRPSDVWVVTYPRSGTTLTQEMVWLILNNDYETAAEVVLNERFPFLEFSTFVSDGLIAEVKNEIGDDKEKLSRFLKIIEPQWEVLERTDGRRYIKTHLPLSLLPPELFTSGAKVIYIARNPKNVVISAYNQHIALRVRHFIGDFETYWDLFENNLMPGTPYWEHVEEGWKHRQDKNFLFLFYEDIIRDYKKAVTELSNFLETPMSNEQTSKLADYLHIDNFRKNQQTTNNYGEFFSVKGPYQHVRVGQSGNWNEYFTGRLKERANKWIREHYKSTTLRFPIDLDLQS